MIKTWLKSNTDWLVIISISGMPILLWILAPALTPRFSDLTISLANLGQITALVGTALFALNFILSARLKFIEKSFKGLNRVYLHHNKMGQLALILLLVHPLFLIPKYSGQTWAGAANFLSLTADWSKNWGWLALALMLFLIILTLYLRPKYNIWKWTHKFLGLAFLLAGFHVFLIPSDVSRNFLLRFYMLGLISLGLIAFAYYTLLGKWLRKKYKYEVSDINPLNNQITEIRLKPLAEKLEYTPGQFIFINFITPGFSRESHPFTLALKYPNDIISIIIKNLGDYTQKVKSLKPGTLAEIDGPYGQFFYKNCQLKEQIWIAGGIGITPFLALIQELKTEDGYEVDLYYCTKNESETIYLTKLNRHAELHQGLLRIIPFYSDRKGLINADYIEKISGNLNRKGILMCAPPAMIQSLRRQFLAKGVNPNQINSEEFNF